MCSSIDVLTAVRLREGMSPVGSPGLSCIFASSQKSPTPRTPSGPRLAVQAAGPSTRPDEAGVTFPRRDTLPGIAFGRYVSFITLSTVLSFSLTSSLSFCRQSGKDNSSFLDHSLWIMTEWKRISLISSPLTLVIIPFPRNIGHRSIHLPGLDRAECIAILSVAAS